MKYIGFITGGIAFFAFLDTGQVELLVFAVAIAIAGVRVDALKG
jgi:hypothetical protein